jgi:hypothetical protein
MKTSEPKYNLENVVQVYVILKKIIPLLLHNPMHTNNIWKEKNPK